MRTHGDFAPGEMLDRKYNWPAAVDQQFSFGMVDRDATREGAKAALLAGRDLTKPTRVVTKVSEDFRDVNNDKLGLTRNMMQGRLPAFIPPDFAFGATAKEAGEGNTTRDCINGDAPLEQLLPDPDLGKCIIPGRRNQTSSSRAFGCPSVRADIPRPAHRSLADVQNYGDEVAAAALLSPQRFETMGVPDEEFLCRRPKPELKRLIQACAGHKDTDDETFDAIYDRAARLYEAGDHVSLDAWLYCSRRS